MNVFSFSSPNESLRKTVVRGRLLGEGTYGAVYLSSVRGAQYAEKVAVPAPHNAGNGVPPDVLREVSFLRSALHPCILRPLHVVINDADKNVSFTLPLRKCTLERCMHSLDSAAVSAVSAAVVDTIAYAHSVLDVVHRDIKPSNVMWDPSVTPPDPHCCHVIDWGLSKPLTCGVHTPEVQTLWYRSPELLLGCETYGHPADVWALGCLLLHLWTGVVVKGSFELDQLHRYIRLIGSPPSSFASGAGETYPFLFGGLPVTGPSLRWKNALRKVGPARADILTHMLAWDPSQRWTMAHVRSAVSKDGVLVDAPPSALALLRRSHTHVLVRPPRSAVAGLTPELWGPEASRVFRFMDQIPERRGLAAHILDVLRRWVCKTSSNRPRRVVTPGRLATYGRLWSWVILKLAGLYTASPASVGLNDTRSAAWAIAREPTLLWDVEWVLEDRSTHRQVFTLLDKNHRRPSVWRPVSDALDVTMLSLTVYDFLAAHAQDIAAKMMQPDSTAIPKLVVDAANAVSLDVAAGRLGDFGSDGMRWFKARMLAMKHDTL